MQASLTSLSQWELGSRCYFQEAFLILPFDSEIRSPTRMTKSVRSDGVLAVLSAPHLACEPAQQLPWLPVTVQSPQRSISSFAFPLGMGQVVSSDTIPGVVERTAHPGQPEKVIWAICSRTGFLQPTPSSSTVPHRHPPAQVSAWPHLIGLVCRVSSALCYQSNIPQLQCGPLVPSLWTEETQKKY